VTGREAQARKDEADRHLGWQNDDDRLGWYLVCPVEPGHAITANAALKSYYCQDCALDYVEVPR